MAPPRLQGALRSQLGEHAAPVPWHAGRDGTKAAQTAGQPILVFGRTLGNSRLERQAGTAGWSSGLERQGQAQLQCSKGSKQQQGRAATARLPVGQGKQL